MQSENLDLSGNVAFRAFKKEKIATTPLNNPDVKRVKY